MRLAKTTILYQTASSWFVSEKMASRVIEAGTVVTRVQHLLRCGVLKERPLWLDVVERFPPITTLKHNQLPEQGRPPTLHYWQDRLKKDFLKKYKVISNKGASVSPERAVISLLEGTGEQLSPSVVERVVEEQLRLMREGDGKDEAMAAAVSQVNATDDSITIQPLLDPQPAAGREEERRTNSAIEKTIMEMNKILTSDSK